MNYYPYHSILKDGEGAIVTNLITGEQKRINNYKLELRKALEYFKSLDPIYRESIQYKNVLRELEKG